MADVVLEGGADFFPALKSLRHLLACFVERVVDSLRFWLELLDLMTEAVGEACSTSKALLGVSSRSRVPPITFL